MLVKRAHAGEARGKRDRFDGATACLQLLGGARQPQLGQILLKCQTHFPGNKRLKRMKFRIAV